MFTRKGIVVTSHIFIVIKYTYFCHLNWESRLAAKISCAVCQLQYLQEISSLWMGYGFLGCFAIADSRGTALHQPHSPQCKSGEVNSSPFPAVAWSLTKPPTKLDTVLPCGTWSLGTEHRSALAVYALLIISFFLPSSFQALVRAS